MMCPPFKSVVVCLQLATDNGSDNGQYSVVVGVYQRWS